MTDYSELEMRLLGACGRWLIANLLEIAGRRCLAHEGFVQGRPQYIKILRRKSPSFSEAFHLMVIKSAIPFFLLAFSPSLAKKRGLRTFVIHCPYNLTAFRNVYFVCSAVCCGLLDVGKWGTFRKEKPCGTGNLLCMILNSSFSSLVSTNISTGRQSC